jgi:hypothetical protein
MVLKPRPALALHPAFTALCAHYGTEPARAWPCPPERKGKTERSFLDLVREELMHETYADLAALQVALGADDEAYARRRHTTTGEAPIDRLERERRFLKKGGYKVSIAQNPTISLADDVAVTKRTLAAQDGPAILVGHRYLLRAVRELSWPYSGRGESCGLRKARTQARARTTQTRRQEA